MFFQTVKQHRDMACNAVYMLRQGRADKALMQASALRYEGAVQKVANEAV